MQEPNMQPYRNLARAVIAEQWQRARGKDPSGALQFFRPGSPDLEFWWQVAELPGEARRPETWSRPRGTSIRRGQR